MLYLIIHGCLKVYAIERPGWKWVLRDGGIDDKVVGWEIAFGFSRDCSSIFGFYREGAGVFMPLKKAADFCLQARQFFLGE
jgi:hypothetical protein